MSDMWPFTVPPLHERPARQLQRFPDATRLGIIAWHHGGSTRLAEHRAVSLASRSLVSACNGAGRFPHQNEQDAPLLLLLNASSLQPCACMACRLSPFMLGPGHDTRTAPSKELWLI